MSDGFQVTMSDLLAAANRFRSEGEDFGRAMPGGGPAPADGGSWVINDALAQVLESVGLLHTQLTGVIGDDANSLAASYREYKSAEDKITTVVRGVVVNPARTRQHPLCRTDLRWLSSPTTGSAVISTA